MFHAMGLWSRGKASCDGLDGANGPACRIGTKCPVLHDKK
jgi:hypothetical protein